MRFLNVRHHGRTVDLSNLNQNRCLLPSYGFRMIDDVHDPKMREFRYRAYHDIPDDKKLKAMSDIELDSLLHSSKDNPVKVSAIDREIQRLKKTWYEKPIGLVAISLVSGLLLAGVIFYLGWR